MSLRAWAARGAVSVAAATAVSLGVTTSAQAFVPPPPIPIIGGVVTAGAEAATAGAVACAASVVCAVGVGALAVGTGLYMTRDSWIPWVQGILPGPGASQGPSLVGPTVVMGQITPVDSHTVAYNVFNTQTTGPLPSPRWISTLVCSVGGAYSVATTGVQILTMPNGQTSQFTPSCGAATIVAAIMTQNPAYTSSTQTLANFSRWGSTDVATVEPAVNWKVTVKCVTAGGTTQDLVIQYSGVAGGFKMPSCEAAGIGNHGAGVKVEGQYPGTSTWQKTYENNPVTNSAYPACQITVYDGRCVLEIYVNGSPCQVGASVCVDWMRRVQQEGATNYSCRWGPYTLPMARCDLLERAYETGGSTITEPNTDGNPDTKTETTPNPTVTGGTQPGGGTVPDPSTWPGAEGTPEPGQDGGECFPSGWGVFNPAGWVVQPLKCVFIPSETLTETRTADLRAQLDQVGVVPIINAVGGNFESLTASGCGGIPVDVTLSGQHVHMQFGEACSGPMANLATYTRALSAVVIVVAGGLAFIRLLSAAFGYNFTLGRGGGDSA